MSTTIEFTPAKLRSLKAAYKKALANGVEHFTFEDKPLLVSYAKYLIEYLDTQLKRR